MERAPEPEQSTNADLVAEFHRAVRADLPDQPTVPDAELLALRRSLLTEEYREVTDEMERLRVLIDNDGVDEALALLAHELADLLYVTYGAMLALGIPANAVFHEVHRANLAKASGPRRSDGKQLKPAGWVPADVGAVLRAMHRG